MKSAANPSRKKPGKREESSATRQKGAYNAATTKTKRQHERGKKRKGVKSREDQKQLRPTLRINGGKNDERTSDPKKRPSAPNVRLKKSRGCGDSGNGKIPRRRGCRGSSRGKHKKLFIKKALSFFFGKKGRRRGSCHSVRVQAITVPS